MFSIKSSLFTGICSEPMSSGKIVSRPQDFVLWHRSLPVLCDVWTGCSGLPYGGLLFESKSGAFSQFISF